MEERARQCADRLAAADRVLVVSHIDADGLTSAGIATIALQRADIAVATAFAKQLDAAVIAGIAASSFDTVLFTDFGSGQLPVIAKHAADDAFTAVIADHHRPVEADVSVPYHLNPMEFGLDGASELSGAGTVYLLARALGGEENCDLAGLAVVGAVGDMQASDGELDGANARIVAEGVEDGVVSTGTDLALYGKQTRPLPKLLEYASEVSIPGVSNTESGSIRFLDSLDVDLRRGDAWRTWADLAPDERQAVVSALIQRAVERGVPAYKIDALVGTTYELTEEPTGTALRDASEFSTLLNATARYDRPDVGLAVCLGDREDALGRAKRLLADHRRNLSMGLELVSEIGVTKEANLQWFHAEDRIRETIVGIVAGMALGVDGVDPGRPIVAFAEADDGIKVSTRGTPALVRRGLDLSTVMEDAATEVGGEGGGHDVAAGATIPAGTERAFVELANEIVRDQLTAEA